MQVRPFKAVRQIRKSADGPYDVAAKTVSLLSLVAYAFLDQKTRPRGKKAEPTRAGAKRVIQLKFARYARLLVLAHLQDRARRRNQTNLSQKLLNEVWKNGGLTALAKISPSGDLIETFQLRSKDVSYVIGVVDYLLRSHIYPEDGLPSTIEDAKGFVWLWRSEYGVTKISQVWELYKLAAPYLYALHLERSFRPSKIDRVVDVLDWAKSFVKSSRRVERFIGHAAFTMDVLKTFARDQRESDFIDAPRVKPPLRHFDQEEKLVSANIDRTDLHYGRAFRDPPAAAQERPAKVAGVVRALERVARAPLGGVDPHRGRAIPGTAAPS